MDSRGDQGRDNIRSICELDQFFSKVDIGEDNECWLWKANTASGYGQITIGGEKLLAHRVAYKLFYGQITPGKEICHNCPTGDNPLCVNPRHLREDDHKGNMRDKVAKGRQPNGERIKCAKLTEDSVKEIRGLYSSNQLNTYELADLFGISEMQISRVVRRKAWAHVN